MCIYITLLLICMLFGGHRLRFFYWDTLHPYKLHKRSNLLFSSALFVLFLIEIENKVNITFNFLAFAHEAEMLQLPNNHISPL